MRACYLVTHCRHIYTASDGSPSPLEYEQKNFSIEGGLGNGIAFPRERPHVTIILKIDKKPICRFKQRNNSLITEITVTKASLLNNIGLIFNVKIITLCLKIL